MKRPVALHELQRLRILVAIERRKRLDGVAATLGHEVIAPEIQVERAASARHERADIALTGLGSSKGRALHHRTEIMREGRVR